MDDQDKWFTPKEAAAFLGVKENTLAIWRCTKRYNLPYHKVGGRVRYKLVDLNKFKNGN